MRYLPILVAIILTLNFVSAVSIDSVETSTLAPGSEGTIRIEVENELDTDAKDVSLSLSYANLPFIPIGTSEHYAEEIDEDDEEDFVFHLKASSGITPGDYEIPYTLEFKIDDEKTIREGSFGIKVVANPDLTFTADTENPIVGKKGTVTLKIINKGFYDARFVSVNLVPSGFTLMSEKEVYIGEIESDDFETANFDVIFKNKKANLEAIVEYVDFDNQKQTETVKLPLTVYTPEKAIELGILAPNKTVSYTITFVVLLILFILWRTWRRYRRQKKSKLR